MKKSTLLVLVFVLFSLHQTSAQRTFETLLNTGTIYSAEQNPDGSYILCFDSAGAGVMKLDECGQVLWSARPSVRRSDESIYSVAPDLFTGGYVAGGNSPDSTGVVDNEPFLMLLDANGNKTASRLLPPGDVGGNVSSVRSSPDSGYTAGLYIDNFGGSNASLFGRFDQSLGDVWDFSGSGSQVNSSSVDINASNQYVFASYNGTAATAPSIRQLDAAGVLLNTFVLPDTFQGGVLFMRNAVVDHTADGNYIVGSTLSPFASSYDYPYILKLDNGMNVLWQKIFDWGESAQIHSILATPDSGSICMLGKKDTVVFVRLNSVGDSLWSKTYAGLGTVKVNEMRHCMDGGYLLSGSTSDGVDNFGFILKLDSEAQLLPPVCVQAVPSTFICPGTSMTLSVDAGYQYLWSTAETTQSIVVDTAGTYYVIVTDSVSGLSAQSDPIEVSIYPTTIPVINLLGNMLVSTNAVTYQWMLNGDTLIGETQVQVIPQVAGDYTVMIVDANGCVLTSAPYPFVIPGIKKLESDPGFVVNRISHDIVEVSVYSSKSGLLRLFDLRGVAVKELDVNSGVNTLKIPVNDLATGVYSLVWTSEQSFQAQKILLGY